MGRKCTYTKEVADEVIERLSKGESLRSICKSWGGTPSSHAIRLWALNDIDGFASRYTQARDLGLDEMADEVFEVSDDGDNDWMKIHRKDGSEGWQVNGECLGRSRLRFDARRWYLSKMAPKRYGDKLQQEITNPDGSLSNLSEAQVAARLAAIEAAVLKRKADAEAQEQADEPHDDSDGSDLC